MISVRESPPLRLGVNITSPSGARYRWGADEPAVANVPGDLSFSTTAPGGFESLSCTLPRQPDISYGDLQRLANISVAGPGGQVAWEGRLEGSPRTSGNQFSVSPNAVGWQAHLDDNKSARALYVDRDLSNWGSASRQRKLNIYAAWATFEDPSSEADATTGIPALILTLTGPGGTSNLFCEAWYDAGPGNLVGSIYYDYTSTNTVAGYTANIGTASDDVATANSLSSDLITGSNSSGSGTATPTAYRYGVIDFYTLGASPAGDYLLVMRYLTVWGNTGISKQGTAPNDGVYASDVIAHALSNFAPLLNYSTGSSGTITPSAFIIPQLVFRDPTTASDIISSANRFHLRDWFVWEGPRPGRPTFYYHDRGACGKAWRARVAPAELSETGPSVDRLWNGIIVRFNDVDGTSKTVGPTGATGCDSTSASLVDSDPLNPANQLGIRRWDILDMNGVSTVAGATEVGRRFLEQAKLLDTSGQAQIVGYVEDDHGVRFPSWRVRAGDTITFTDAADRSPRRVIKTNYSDSARTNSIDLDAPPDGLDALLERLQVVLVPLGL